MDQALTTSCVSPCPALLHILSRTTSVPLVHSRTQVAISIRLKLTTPLATRLMVRLPPVTPIQLARQISILISSSIARAGTTSARDASSQRIQLDFLEGTSISTQYVMNGPTRFKDPS